MGKRLGRNSGFEFQEPNKKALWVYIFLSEWLDEPHLVMSKKFCLSEDKKLVEFLGNNNNDDFINVSSKNLAEGIPHC